MTERQLQEHVRGLLQVSELTARIRNRSKIENDASNAATFPGYPQFPVDSLARQKSLRAAQHVLNQLSMTSILSETENVSLRRSERLLPDFVLYNPDRGSFTIVELKTRAKTEREAITELFGYEHELQNQFPFLSTYDVSFLLIATDYSPLLDHSASAVITWGNRNLMCLRVLNEEERLEFDIHLPVPWTALGQNELPPGGLATGTLCLYQCGNEDTDDHFDHANQALELIAQDGNRNHVHGFAFLWKSAYPGNAATFAITVATMNPFAFVSHAIAKGFQVDARLHEKIVQDGYDPMLIQPDAIFSVARRAKQLLSEVFDPVWEGMDTWDAQRRSLSQYTIPIAFRFFGTLGEFTTDLTLNAETRARFLPGLDVGGLDPGNPRVGIQILDRLMGYVLFRGGRFTCKDLAAFGTLLGSLGTLYHTAEPATPQTLLWRANIEWREAELLLVTAEVSDRCAAMKQAFPDPPRLIIGWGAPAADKNAALAEYIDWFMSHFLGAEGSQIYREFLAFGLKGHAWLETVIRESLSPAELEPHRAAVVDFARRMIGWAKEAVADPETGEAFGTAVKQACNLTGGNDAESVLCGLQRMGEDLLLENAVGLPSLIDLLIPPVFHNLRKPSVEGVDWTWLREQVSARRKEGISSIGVIIESDGTVGIGQVNWFGADPVDTEDEVLVSVDMAGVGLTSKRTWSELERGSFFPLEHDESNGGANAPD